MTAIRISATGDSFMTRFLPEKGYEDQKELAELISAADIRFNNLEFTAHKQEGAPAAVSGGTWAMSDPEILDDLNKFGFTVYNTANNHSLDYSQGGVLATLRHLKERNMPAFGTGATLDEAAAPLYVKAAGKTVAFIGLCGSPKDFQPAGNPSSKVIGRPGLNPLRAKTVYHVTEDEYAQLQKIAAETHMNASTNYSIANGYTSKPPAGTFSFGSITFKKDETSFKETVPNEKDVKRTLAGIAEAKKKADLVFISVHSHAFDGECNDDPAQFMKTFCHKMIDGGADGIIGHGPHVMRGIEIYKGKPIFYSLGNFIFQTETVKYQPAEAFTNKGLEAEAEVKDLMLKRSNNDTTGYAAIVDIWRSVVADFTMEDDGTLKEIRLYPISLGMGTPWEKRGWPHLSHDEETLRHMAEMSAAFGTKVEIENGEGIIRL